jgi:tetratricopeptide (TPR) repeat protein
LLSILPGTFFVFSGRYGEPDGRRRSGGNAGRVSGQPLNRLEKARKSPGWTLGLLRQIRLIMPVAATIALTGCAGIDIGTTAGGQPTVNQQNNIASISGVIRKNPNDANALNMRGSAYGQAGEYQQALEDFNAAIRLSPNYHQAYANRALIYVKLKRADQALADYSKAISLAPDYAVAFVGRGNLYRQMKNLPLALADYNRAVQLRNNDPVANFNRGLVRQAMGDHRNAIEDFSNALSMRPDSTDPFFARGISYLAIDDFKRAYDDFTIATSSKASTAEAWAYRARAAEGLGHTKDASRGYKRALQIDPSFKPASEGLARVGSGDGAA